MNNKFDRLEYLRNKRLINSLSPNSIMAELSIRGEYIMVNGRKKTKVDFQKETIEHFKILDEIEELENWYMGIDIEIQDEKEQYEKD